MGLGVGGGGGSIRGGFSGAPPAGVLARTVTQALAAALRFLQHQLAGQVRACEG